MKESNFKLEFLSFYKKKKNEIHICIMQTKITRTLLVSVSPANPPHLSVHCRRREGRQAAEAGPAAGWA